MPANPIAHLEHDLLAIAMRQLRYSLDATDHAVERAAILQAAGLDWHAANLAAVREVDAWPEERRWHRPLVAARQAEGVAA